MTVSMLAIAIESVRVPVRSLPASPPRIRTFSRRLDHRYPVAAAVGVVPGTAPATGAAGAPTVACVPSWVRPPANTAVRVARVVSATFAPRTSGVDTATHSSPTRIAPPTRSPDFAAAGRSAR